MDNENKSKYESTIKWVIEHYPFDKISNIFDITQNISDLKLPEEELEKVFDEYLKNNYELKEGKKYLKYTQDEYERIEKKLRSSINRSQKSSILLFKISLYEISIFCFLSPSSSLTSQKSLSC